MPGCVGIVQRMDNRNVSGSTKQRALGFCVGGVVAPHTESSSSAFDDIVAFGNLLRAWKKFRAGKRSRMDVMTFERRLEDNIFALRDDLTSGRYRHRPYEPFTVFDPKQRSIHKATVRDRLVHQAVVNIIEPYFERQFIYDSFSCRVGKGTHVAVDRLRVFLRRASRNDTKTVYALKCDVRKFFACVDHGILLRLLTRRVHDPYAVALLRRIVESFLIASGKGLPLGNLTSQLFANVYLHELDHFVKYVLRIRYYVRYCDDFVLLTHTMHEATHLVGAIDRFLRSWLVLTLHERKVRIRTWRQGVDFLGYVLLPGATVIRPKIARRMLRRAIPENATSYLGMCIHADAYELACAVRHKICGCGGV